MGEGGRLEEGGESRTEEWLSSEDRPVPLANVGEADEISYRDGGEMRHMTHRP